MTTLKRKGGQPPKKFSEQLAEGQWGFGGGGGRYGSIKKSKPKKPKKSTLSKIKGWHKDLTKGEKRFLHYGMPSIFGVLETTGLLLDKKRQKKEKKKKRTETRKSQRGMSSGGSVNSRAIARKYFRGGLV